MNAKVHLLTAWSLSPPPFTRVFKTIKFTDLYIFQKKHAFDIFIRSWSAMLLWI